MTTILYSACGSSSGADGGIFAATDSKGSAQEAGVNGAGGGMYSMEEAAEYEAYDTADGGTQEEGTGQGAGVREGRKLIQTVGLEVETKEFEQMMSSLETQVEELGGYIENMETYNGSSYSGYVSSRYANLTIRVPNGKLDSFLQTVSDIGNVVRRNDSVEDVTLSYVDMESRRNTLRTEQERLLAFLEKAETIEEIIALEQRLSEVRYELESMESKLRTLDNLIDYSTVELHVSEVRELTEVRQEEPGPGKRIVEGFLRSLRDIGDGLMEFAIWFLTHLPYLVLWAGGIGVAVLLWRKARIRQRRQKENRQREEARIQARTVRMQEWEAGAVESAAPEAGDGKKENNENNLEK
nr:DUF4349 domain-containing protein [uncultured Acetatifactor sp.]